MKLFLTVAMLLLGLTNNGRYLQTSEGTPFFLLGNAAWLLPERLGTEDADLFLDVCQENGYNFVMMQVVNNVPGKNAYGVSSSDEEYWKHIDHIVDKADKDGIYVGMACMWGNVVKNGQVDEDLATVYGEFLGERYKDCNNVIWVMGGDADGSVRPEVWNALANGIKSVDKNHLMTFHPSEGRSSRDWWADAAWLDFDMFHSGNKSYEQAVGAEDNWHFVKDAWDSGSMRPILDGGPCFEDAPRGLNDARQPRWQDYDVRRAAYWSVFSGATGYVYAGNSILQFHPGGSAAGAYGAYKSWKDALKNPGMTQMIHLKNLMLSFPWFERVPDQSVIIGNGEHYDRAVATRGDDYMLIYTFTNKPVQINLTKISGPVKKAFWYDPSSGRLEAAGTLNGPVATMQYNGPVRQGNDHVLIIVNAKSKRYPELIEGDLEAIRNAAANVGEKVGGTFRGIIGSIRQKTAR